MNNEIKIEFSRNNSNEREEALLYVNENALVISFKEGKGKIMTRFLKDEHIFGNISSTESEYILPVDLTNRPIGIRKLDENLKSSIIGSINSLNLYIPSEYILMVKDCINKNYK